MKQTETLWGWMAALWIVALLSGCGASMEARGEDVFSLAPDYFKNGVTIKDDDLDTTAILTSKPGATTPGPSGTNWAQVYLRAFINKRTGEATYQVYQALIYEDYNWRFYQTANYGGGPSPVSTSATAIERKVLTCGSSGGCGYYEAVGFDAPEALLRGLADQYRPGVHAAWHFKFIPRAGPDYQSQLLPAELGGLLGAVDEYRARKGLLSGSAGSARPTPQPAADYPAQPASSPPTPPSNAGGATTAKGIPGESRYMIDAERLAKSAGCAAPVAAMNFRGAGTELFTVACSTGDPLSVRCEAGGCRIMK